MRALKPKIMKASVCPLPPPTAVIAAPAAGTRLTLRGCLSG
jgi:hypothetical protein